jgi:hypothetical protein
MSAQQPQTVIGAGGKILICCWGNCAHPKGTCTATEEGVRYEPVKESGPKTDPITVDELLARGCSDDLEGRALDVVLRCGWPRPGDPLGIKPCIPIDMRALKHVVETIDLDDQRKPAAKLKEVRDFLHSQLRHQEYVRTLYLRTVEGEAAGS